MTITLWMPTTVYEAVGVERCANVEVVRRTNRGVNLTMDMPTARRIRTDVATRANVEYDRYQPAHWATACRAYLRAIDAVIASYGVGT